MNSEDKRYKPSEAGQDEDVESAKNQALSQLKDRLWPLIQPEAFSDLTALYNGILQYLKDHLDLLDERQYHLLATSVLLSYRLSLHVGVDTVVPSDENMTPDSGMAVFNTVPYILFLGPPNSGKTRALEVIETLCDKPLRVGSTTPGGLYQAIQTLAPTLLLDEADLYARRGERWEEIRALLREGYRRGGRVLRGSAELGVPELYDVFCQKYLASRGPLEPALMQRSLVVQMDRAQRQVKAQVDRARAWKLKAQLEYYRFHHPQSSLDPERLKEEVGDARVAELYGPLIAVAPDEDFKAVLKGLAKETWRDRLNEEVIGAESELVHALWILRFSAEREGYLTMKEVADQVNVDRPDRYKLSPDYIGRRLRGLGFRGARKGKQGVRAILWDPQLMERLQRRFLPPEAEQTEGGTPVRSDGSVRSVSQPSSQHPSADTTVTSDTSAGYRGALRLEDVAGVVALDPVIHGSCPLCRRQNQTLCRQVQFFDGSGVDACCMDCGGSLLEELRKRDDVS